MNFQSAAKVCTKCKQPKPLTDFYVRSKATGALLSRCKSCQSAANVASAKKTLAADPEGTRKKRAEWRRENRKKHLRNARARSRAYMARKHEQDPTYRRAQHLKHLYGLTLAQWDELFESQGEKCAICKSPKPHRKNGVWHTDHDHATGKVRGIVCSHCNRLLGAAYDNVQILANAITYLEKLSELE